MHWAKQTTALGSVPKILGRLARNGHRSMLLSWRETASPWRVPSPTFPAINSSEGTTTLIVCYEMAALICKNGSHIFLKYLRVIRELLVQHFQIKFVIFQKILMNNLQTDVLKMSKHTTLLLNNTEILIETLISGWRWRFL